MNTTDRILGEARKARPPTKRERTDPRLAYEYAVDVLGGRFPEGEATIATDPQWACSYAVDVIGGRFPRGEATIVTDPEWAYEYAINAIKGRFQEAEATIATSPDAWAKWYLEAFPEAKLEFAMNGWLDWLDL